jgi:hypothetical protein
MVPRVLHEHIGLQQHVAIMAFGSQHMLII